MAGVLIIEATLSIGTVIADLMVIAQARDNADWNGLVSYLPL